MRSIPALLFLLTLAAGPAAAATLIVRVTVDGPQADAGSIDCALFAAPDGFPTDASKANRQSHPSRADGVTCRWDDVPGGRHAVAIGHDLNGNQRVDTNFLGMPREGWGVSRNTRPTLRAPRFDEAAFEIVAGTDLVLDVAVSK